MPSETITRELHFGENLEVLRRSIADRSVHLVYLDPPFNSNRAFHLWSAAPRSTALRSTTPSGKQDGAHGAVFADKWSWGEQTETEFDELRSGETALAGVLVALRAVLNDSGVMAYLVMMAARLVEIRRVLRPDGALYLHCDPSASHYLKILLDALFGARNFRNEIVWHYYNKFSAGKRVFARCFDQIFFYSASDRYVFNPLREPRQEPVRQLLRENVGGILKNRKDAAGKTMTRIVHDRKVDAVWRIPCLQYASREFCGFPTQKPLALLERIIRASSNPGEVVLDPFCGCGTALLAAQKLERGWIGIDKSPSAMELVQARISENFPDLAYQRLGLPPAETVLALNRAKKRPAL